MVVAERRSGYKKKHKNVIVTTKVKNTYGNPLILFKDALLGQADIFVDGAYQVYYYNNRIETEPGSDIKAPVPTLTLFCFGRVIRFC